MRVQRDMNYKWDEESCDLAKALAAKGWSASEIGRRIGVSRNAVIGKIHRMGAKFTTLAGLPKAPPRGPRPALQGSASGHHALKRLRARAAKEGKPSLKAAEPSLVVEAPPVQPAKPKRPKPAAPVLKLAPEPKVTPKTVSTLGEAWAHEGPLVRYCRWIIGETNGEHTKICGHPPFAEGRSLCIDHARRSVGFNEKAIGRMLKSA